MYSLATSVQNTLRIPFFRANCIVLSSNGRGQSVQVAEIGNIIEFKDGLQGIVEKVNENSVIVDLTYMENFNELELEEKTVISHKRYKILYNNID